MRAAHRRGHEVSEEAAHVRGLIAEAYARREAELAALRAERDALREERDALLAEREQQARLAAAAHEYAEADAAYAEAARACREWPVTSGDSWHERTAARDRAYQHELDAQGLLTAAARVYRATTKAPRVQPSDGGSK